MANCPSCGTSNLDDSHVYCYKCGFGLTGATGKLSAETILEGRYIIVKTLGRGGMGAVYLALDQRLNNSPVAIKEMSTNAVGHGNLQAAIGAFKLEATMLINLRHQALPRITDFFSQGEDRWYLVMDYIEGQTLKNIAQAREKLSYSEVLDWGIQLSSILNYLHNLKPPVIFRDLKPANIMLTPDGVIKLIDFGIARHFRAGVTADTTAYGSTGFAPPEQYGECQTDARADIYALGATLHYLLTGIDPIKNPFAFEAPSKFVEVPANLEEAIMKALELRPENRINSAQEMLRYLKNEPSVSSEQIPITESNFTQTPLTPDTVLLKTPSPVTSEDFGTSEPLSEPLINNIPNDSVDDGSENSETSYIDQAAAKAYVEELLAKSNTSVVKNTNATEMLKSNPTPIKLETNSNYENIQSRTSNKENNNENIKRKTSSNDSNDQKTSKTKFIGIGALAFISIVILGLYFSRNSEPDSPPVKTEAAKATVIKGTLPITGGMYEGEILDKQMHGKGKLKMANGTILEGTFSNNKLEGKGSKTLPTGEKYIGEFKASMMNDDKGTYTWPNGDKYIGEFKDDKITGYGTKTWGAGKRKGGKYEGDFVNGLMQGNGTFIWANHIKYTGEFSGDKLNGKGEMTWPNGSKFKGDFRNNMILYKGRLYKDNPTD